MGGQGMTAAVDTCRVRKVPQLLEAAATQTPAWLSPPAVKSLGRAVQPRSLPPALALALGVFAFIAMLKREFTSDTILDAYAGRLVANHGIPFHNTLTAVGYGREWIDQQWLGQLVIYAVQWAAGWPGVAALSAAAVALTGALSFRLLRERLSVLRSLEATILVLAALESNTAARTQTLCYPLWCVVLWLVVAQPERLTRRRALVVLVTLIVWANIHGSIVLAAGTVAVCCTVHAWRLPALRRRFALLVAGALLAPFVTPYGFTIVRYYRSILANDTMQAYSSEWRHPGFDLASGGFLAVLAFAVVVALHFRQQWRAMLSPAGILTLVIAGLTLHSLRFGAWFGLPAAIAFAQIAGVPQLPARDRAPRWIGASTLVAAVLAVVLIGASSTDSYETLAPPTLLEHADEALAVHPRSVLLADSTLSPAMLWAHPNAEGRVLYDIRWETYTPDEMRGYAAALEGRLPGYAHRCVVIAAGANSAFRAHVDRRPNEFGAIAEIPQGVIALTPACTRKP
jgi:hypothetical protein